MKLIGSLEKGSVYIAKIRLNNANILCCVKDSLLCMFETCEIWYHTKRYGIIVISYTGMTMYIIYDYGLYVVHYIHMCNK